MRLFVSYSRKDATAARQLISDLEKASLSAWHDHELHGGDPWWQDILQQIRNCDVFVLALSDNVLASKPCMAELGYARALKLPIIPVQIGPVGNIRATPVADIQVLDYRARTADDVLALLGAIYPSGAERAPLPDPLPHPPAVPFEYLVRLGSAITAAELSPQEQGKFVHQLRECHQGAGPDASAREPGPTKNGPPRADGVTAAGRRVTVPGVSAGRLPGSLWGLSVKRRRSSK